MSVVAYAHLTRTLVDEIHRNRGIFEDLEGFMRYWIEQGEMAAMGIRDESAAWDTVAQSIQTRKIVEEVLLVELNCVLRKVEEHYLYGPRTLYVIKTPDIWEEMFA